MFENAEILSLTLNWLLGSGYPTNWGCDPQLTWLTTNGVPFPIVFPSPASRDAPAHFAPWRTVYHDFRLRKKSGLWVAIHTHLQELVRLLAARPRHASAAIIDRQSVKSPECSDECGYDAGKKIKGRKWPIWVATMGLLLRVLVLPAPIQDRQGGQAIAGGLLAKTPRRRGKHI